MEKQQTIYDKVKDYYGKQLQKTTDLQTNACCTSKRPPQYISEVISLIHEEVEKKYYGCGLVIPDVLEKMKILDLGSGSGRDVFILSKLVGQEGFVVGVDMTEEQINIANKYIDYHMKKFGYSKSNVEFKKGYIERLNEIGLQDNSFDIIVSNCVINLSPDKESVLKEAYRVLKPGGELYFSDVYSDRRIPNELINDPILYGECLSGALYWNDFLNLAKQAGFKDPRLVVDTPITINNQKIQDLLGPIRFFSATYRLFKLNDLEPDCEDYGQAVIYKGGIITSPHYFNLDSHHKIEKGKIFPVCGNTYSMLKNTRFSKYFEFIGNKNCHYGLFEGCGKNIPFQSVNNTNNNSSSNNQSSCCC